MLTSALLWNSAGFETLHPREVTRAEIRDKPGSGRPGLALTLDGEKKPTSWHGLILCEFLTS